MSKKTREASQNKRLSIQTPALKGEGPASRLLSSGATLELLTLGKRRSTDSHRQVLASLTKPFPSEIDPIRIVAAARAMGNIVNYWALPSKKSWIVGVGEAAEIIADGPLRFKQAAAQLQGILQSAIVETEGPTLFLGGPIFLGGFRFNSESRSDGLWDGFNDGLLTLPRWMVASLSDGQCSLTVNVVLNARTNVDALRRELISQSLTLFDDRETSHNPATESVKVEPVADGWVQKVTQALDTIKAGKLSKVTLARTMTVHSDTTIPPETILRSLTANYPECRTFAFCRGRASFVGASPEELVSLNGANVTSTCLAGSAPRGESEATDKELSNWLLQNEKERREHEVVVDWISERMGALCSTLHWNDVPYVLRLGNVQHLATSFVGTRAEGRHVLDFVEALHPTPAVGGAPLVPAMEMIGRLENFDRGWYTGPVGWVDGKGNGEFAVAIRCALLRDNEAFLYAGDGIVAGSDPETEEHETSMKFKPLLTALGAT